MDDNDNDTLSHYTNNKTNKQLNLSIDLEMRIIEKVKSQVVLLSNRRQRNGIERYSTLHCKCKWASRRQLIHFHFCWYRVQPWTGTSFHSFSRDSNFYSLHFDLNVLLIYLKQYSNGVWIESWCSSSKLIEQIFSWICFSIGMQ